MVTLAQKRMMWDYSKRAPVIPQPSPTPSPGWAPRAGQVLQATWGYCTDQGTHYPFPAVDAFAPIGTPLWAPKNGISYPETTPLGGNTTFFLDDTGMWWYFAHASVPFQAGRIKQGQPFGKVGQTGNARYTDPHCHFASAPDSDFNRGINGGSGTVWFQPWVWGGK